MLYMFIAYMSKERYAKEDILYSFMIQKLNVY